MAGDPSLPAVPGGTPLSVVGVKARATPAAGRADTRLWPWALVLFGVGMLLTLAQGINRTDESWFLQVLRRMLEGETLYRDIWFGATPLAPYAGVAVAGILGVEIVAVKILASASFAAVGTTSVWIMRRLGIGTTPLWLVAALLLYSPPVQAGPYTPLAIAGLLGAFAAVLGWVERGTVSPEGDIAWRFTILAGVAAGLAFLSKQNLGLLALGASIVGIVSAPGATTSVRLRGAGMAALAFVVVSALGLVPVAVTGGLPDLLEYGFLGKRQYVQLAAVSYLTGLGGIVHFTGLADAYLHTAFLLPPVVVSALLLALGRGQSLERGRCLVVLLFVAASLASLYPRADLAHVRQALPAVFLGVACIGGTLGRRQERLRRRGAWLAGTWLAGGFVLVLASPLVGMASGELTVSTLPRFRGPLIESSQVPAIRDSAAALRAASLAEGSIFVLSPDAGFIYLASGLKDPTPYDFPLASVLGREGDQRVIDAIRDGSIRLVCLHEEGMDAVGPLRPRLLHSYVVESMQRGPDVGFCSLYRPR